ncbi:DUF460 domain-containing protein [Candidatus Woesearchaeota archaeon]|nr:DUF460 domain-containing protein [Candidatus Woesearchaeota archaeon]
MEEKRLLIVGIDPGTTMGYAILDIEGNLVYLNSSKQYDLNKLISETINLGKIVLVGTDKVKVPSFVEMYSTKVGAKIQNPEEDLKVEEKRKMISSYAYVDEHQGDALASALFAFKSIKNLLDKIDNFVEENKRQDIKNRLKELVITKRISIKTALSIIENKNGEDRIVGKVIVEKKFDEKDFLKLYEKLKKYEKEVYTLKKYNTHFKNKIMNLEKVQNIKNKNSNTKTIDFREKRIRFLESRLKSEDKVIMQLKAEIERLNYIISGINKFYILKRLDTLSINKFNLKNKTLNVQNNDILLVNNPNIFSDEVVLLLKNKVFIIVYKENINKKVENALPFIFINTKNLKIEEYKYFGLVEKKLFESEKSKIDWVRKIVEDYKKEKKLIY